MQTCTNPSELDFVIHRQNQLETIDDDDDDDDESKEIVMCFSLDRIILCLHSIMYKFVIEINNKENRFNFIY